MRRLIFVVIALSFACKGRPVPEARDGHGVGDSKKESPGFYALIGEKFTQIDTLHGDYPFEKRDSLEDDLISILKRYKDTLLNLPDTLDYNFLYVSKSADRKLCLVSWDTRQGGTMIDFATMAIFKTESGTKTSLLHNEDQDDTYMHYDTVITLKTAAGKTLYLALGFGQGSTALPLQDMRALMIRGDSIGSPKIFPGKETVVSVGFDNHQFGDSDRVPTIKIRDSGRQFLVPQATDEGGFAGQYKSYVFVDSVFVIKKYR